MRHYTLTSPRHKQKLALPLHERPLNRFQRRFKQFLLNYNQYKSTIERFMFGQFTVCKPLPDSIDIGSNRQSSKVYSDKHIFRVKHIARSWNTFKKNIGATNAIP